MPKPNFTPTQLSAMAVNPQTKGRLVDAYPHLGILLHDAELTHGDEEDKLLRYLAYAYDPNSPMARSHPDLRTRKEDAIKATGYNPKEGHAKATILFLQRVVKSLEWRLICTAQHFYNECEERMNDPIKTGSEVKDTDIMAAQQKKSALFKEMKDIVRDLPALREQFYGGDKELEESAEIKDRRPENMAGFKKW